MVNERFLNLFAECLRSPDEQVVQRSCSCILEVVNKVRPSTLGGLAVGGLLLWWLAAVIACCCGGIFVAVVVYMLLWVACCCVACLLRSRHVCCKIVTAGRSILLLYIRSQEGRRGGSGYDGDRNAIKTSQGGVFVGVLLRRVAVLACCCVGMLLCWRVALLACCLGGVLLWRHVAVDLTSRAGGVGVTGHGFAWGPCRSGVLRPRGADGGKGGCTFFLFAL